MWLGMACTTVTGTIDPFSSNTQVIPSFFPINAGVMAFSPSSVVSGQLQRTTDHGQRTEKYFHQTSGLSASGSWLNPTVHQRIKMPLKAGACHNLKLRLDLHEHTGRNDKAIERFNRAGGGFKDIDDALVRAHLELFARFFIDMRAAQHRISLDPGRHGDGAADTGVGPLGVVDDF